MKMEHLSEIYELNSSKAIRAAIDFIEDSKGAYQRNLEKIILVAQALLALKDPKDELLNLIRIMPHGLSYDVLELIKRYGNVGIGEAVNLYVSDLYSAAGISNN